MVFVTQIRKIFFVLGFLMVKTIFAMDGGDDIAEMKVMFEKAKPHLTLNKALFGVQVYEEIQGPAQKGLTLKRKYYDLSGVSLFAQGTATEGLDILSSFMVNRFLREPENKPRKYEFEDVAVFYLLRHGQALKMAIMKPLYPSHLALRMLGEASIQDSGKLFNRNGDLEDLLKKYNGSELEENKIYKVTRELEETKKILVEDVMEKLKIRGDDLEELQGRTAELKTDCEAFRKKAKEMNSCCWLF